MNRSLRKPLTSVFSLALAGCAVGTNEPRTVESADADSAAWNPSALAAIKGDAIACSANGTTKKMTITLADGEVALVMIKSKIFVNGAAVRCPTETTDSVFGGTVAGNVKLLDVRGPATAPDAATAKGIKVMFDGQPSALPAGTAASALLNVTLPGGARDEVWVRSGTAADSVSWRKDADATKINNGSVSLGLVGGRTEATKNLPRKDIAVQGAGGLVFFLGAGNDTLAAGDAKIPVRVFAGEGNDIVTTGDADDLLQGSAGNDTLVGGKGNDLLQGSDGNDTLNGHDGDDGLDGGAGDDVLEGHAGCDAFNGGAGEDFNYDSDASQRVAGVEGDFSFGQTACTGNAPDVFGGAPAGGGSSGGGSSGGGSSGGGSSGGGSSGGGSSGGGSSGGATGNCATAPKFVIADSGTEVNQCNGLVWQRTPDSTRRTLAAAQEYCSNLGAGYRLPTLPELYALIDFSKASGPHIDTSKFNPGPAIAIAPSGLAIPGIKVVDAANGHFYYYNPSEYWTSSGTGITGGANQFAFVVAFDAVYSGIGFSKEPAHVSTERDALVRCVRGTAAADACSTGASPAENGDGSVTDCAGLRWKKTQSSRPLSLSEATDYCAAFPLGPWRLPTSAELLRVSSLNRLQSLLDNNSFTDAKQCGYVAEWNFFYEPSCSEHDKSGWPDPYAYPPQDGREMLWTSTTTQYTIATQCATVNQSGQVVVRTEADGCTDDSYRQPGDPLTEATQLVFDANYARTDLTYGPGHFFARCVK